MEEVIGALIAAIGDAVSTDAAELELCRTDYSGHKSASRPLAIVHARDVADVQAAMRIADGTGTPVVVRGAGTGLAGAAIASGGEIVLSTLRLNRILEISAADEYAIVEPGVINAELNRTLAAYGLWFSPDPASREISTIGGNIATNAGGLLCAKYGVTRESVLGLTIVCADGRLMELGRRTVKGVTGLDLVSLMIGSEGRLGVVVRAIVKLRRVTEGEPSTVAAYFPTVELAAQAASELTAAGIRPAVMELLDAHAVRAICEHLALPVRSEACLLVRTDGVAAAQEADAALAIIRSHGGDASLTTDRAEGDRLFDFRRAFHPAMEARGTVLIEDVCVPRSALAAMFRAIDRISGEYGIEMATVAHAGDGNLHPNFVCEGPEIPEHVWAAADELFTTALKLGGTLTGEHGIGVLKKRWLEAELGSDQLELQRRIARVFDPNGILNPGKVM